MVMANLRSELRRLAAEVAMAWPGATSPQASLPAGLGPAFCVFASVRSYLLPAEVEELLDIAARAPLATPDGIEVLRQRCERVLAALRGRLCARAGDRGDAAQ
jgi:hypothetical protein